MAQLCPCPHCLFRSAVQEGGAASSFLLDIGASMLMLCHLGYSCFGATGFVLVLTWCGCSQWHHAAGLVLMQVDSTMGSTAEGRDSALWPDIPKGPLSVCRARASFSSKELLLFWDNKDVLQFKVRVTWSLAVSLFPDRSDFEVLKPSDLSSPHSSVVWIVLGTV